MQWSTHMDYGQNETAKTMSKKFIVVMKIMNGDDLK